MKSLVILVLLDTIALAITVRQPHATTTEEENNSNDNELGSPKTDEEAAFKILGGTGRFLADKAPRGAITCDRYPRVCRPKGSSRRTAAAKNVLM